MNEHLCFLLITHWLRDTGLKGACSEIYGFCKQKRHFYVLQNISGIYPWMMAPETASEYRAQLSVPARSASFSSTPGTRRCCATRYVRDVWHKTLLYHTLRSWRLAQDAIVPHITFVTPGKIRCCATRYVRDVWHNTLLCHALRSWRLAQDAVVPHVTFVTPGTRRCCATRYVRDVWHKTLLCHTLRSWRVVNVY
jgi:hypothetical protein